VEKSSENDFERTGVRQQETTTHIQNLQNYSGDIRVNIGSCSFTVSNTSGGSNRSSGSGFGGIERNHAEGHHHNWTMDNRNLCRHIQRFGNHPDTVRRGLSNAPEREQESSNRVDTRNYEGIYTNHFGSRYHSRHRIRRLPILRKLQMVCKAVLKPSIPFAVVSSIFIGTAVKKASAATLSPADVVTQFKGPLYPFAFKPDGSLHMGVIPSLPKIPSIPDVKAGMDNFHFVMDTCAKIIQFFYVLPQNIAHYTDVLMGKLYEWLMYLLQTPTFIFNNSAIQNASLVFAGISILIVTLLTMIEGNKQMLKQKHTDFKRICQRYFVAILGAGIAPVLFEKSFELINALTRAIGQIGHTAADPRVALTFTGTVDAWLSAVGLIAFDVLLVAMLIPVLLQNVRRFFDLMVLAAVTPLALTAWVFDDYRHMFDEWWRNVKKMSLTPLVYAVFVSLMGLLIFGIQNVTFGGLIAKIAIMIGGLYRMANPPSFVTRKMDNGDDVEDMGADMWKSMLRAKDNLTGKNLVTGKVLVKRAEKKKKEKIKLRVKRGRRSK
jgi:hypothetical protein